MSCLKRVANLWLNFRFSFICCCGAVKVAPKHVQGGLFGVLLVGVYVILIIGLRVVSPYRETINFSQQPSTCETQGFEFLENQTCHCPPFATCVIKLDLYKHSCIRVYINYTDVMTGYVISNVTLYRSPYMYRGKCFSYECGSGVEQYDRIGKKFPCYPAENGDPEAMLSVIALWHVLLAMLLPTAIYIGIIIRVTIKFRLN